MRDSIQKQLLVHSKEDTVRVALFVQLSRGFFGEDPAQSVANAEKALKLAEKLSYHKGIAEAKIWLAMGYNVSGENQTAVKYGLSAEFIAEKYNLKPILAESYRTLAILYTDHENLTQARKYYAKAEKLAREGNQTGLLTKILNGWGHVEIRSKNYPEALKLFFESLAMAKKLKLDFYQTLILSNIGETYGSSYYNNLRLQEKYYREALAYAKMSNNKFAEATILSNLGQMYMDVGNYTESESYLQSSLKMCQLLNAKVVTKKVYLKLVELFLKKNNFSKAKSYIEQYYELRNTLMSEERSKQIFALEKHYESEKSEQKIKLLEQEKRLQIASKNFWIIGSIFLFMVAVVIYYLQRSRNHKARQLLAMQKTMIGKLEEADLIKSRFFANISHEFRTPLSLILAPVEEMLQSGRTVTARQNDLKMVKRNADRLLDLVNQLLDLSKLDAGKMKLRIQNGNLNEWLRILAASFDSLAEARKIHFVREINAPERNAWFDKDKLEKIVTNILSNAFKFTGKGGHVNLSINANEALSELEITVNDTGKGISPEDMPHIFSPFYQSQVTSADGQLGTGLGLALVSELIRLYRGQIDVKSELGEGTAIHITIPYCRERLDFAEVVATEISNNFSKGRFSENLVTPAASAIPRAADCLLVVEDNSELRHFIANVFCDEFKVITAADGEDGLNKAIEFIPDLVISDVMMPLMDGIELTDSIRNNKITSHIPVLLLTAKTDSDSRMDGLRNGADDYLAKPFSTDELRVRVSNLIKMRKKLAAKYRDNIFAEEREEKIVSADERFIAAIRAVVEEHISDTTFSVEQLAEEMCLSRTQLFRKVKALLDISPNELINDIRLQRAAILIRAKADSLTQISYSVGFNEQSYFAKRFRKKFGVTPSEYAIAAYSVALVINSISQFY